jgi:hypothetical protein
MSEVPAEYLEGVTTASTYADQRRCNPESLSSDRYHEFGLKLSGGEVSGLRINGQPDDKTVEVVSLCTCPTMYSTSP